jgi:hypothetical protein
MGALIHFLCIMRSVGYDFGRCLHQCQDDLVHLICPLLCLHTSASRNPGTQINMLDIRKVLEIYSYHQQLAAAVGQSLVSDTSHCTAWHYRETVQPTDTANTSDMVKQ